jgi:hypothetical protein
VNASMQLHENVKQNCVHRGGSFNTQQLKNLINTNVTLTRCEIENVDMNISSRE